jgi:hypothetical protein
MGRGAARWHQHSMRACYYWVVRIAFVLVAVVLCGCHLIFSGTAKFGTRHLIALGAEDAFVLKLKATP